MAETKPEREHFAETTKFVKAIVSEFMKQIDALTSRTLEILKGDVVGEQVAKFYNKLREAGIPDELAEKLAMEYAKRLLEALKPETKLVSMLLPKGLVEAGKSTLIAAATAADRAKVTVVKKLIESLNIPEETKRSIIAMLEEALKGGEKQQSASQGASQ